MPDAPQWFRPQVCEISGLNPYPGPFKGAVWTTDQEHLLPRVSKTTQKILAKAQARQGDRQ